MKKVINKQLYNFVQSKFQKNRQHGRIKNTTLATKLHAEYNFGKLDLSETWLTYTLNDRLTLSKSINAELGVDIMFDDYPAQKHRNENSINNRNEKENSHPVTRDFVLINSITSLKINKCCHNIAPITSLGTYIRADDVQSIEHKNIVFVENLAVMASLSALNLSSLTEDLSEALWVYRGDIKKHQSTATAYQFFRRFKNHQRICFSDVDPKGIEIALTSDADYWLTIENIDDFKNVVNSLGGSEEEWFKQRDSIKFLQKEQIKQEQNFHNNPAWEPLFSVTTTWQKTLKQEHIIAHELTLTLLKI